MNHEKALAIIENIRNLHNPCTCCAPRLCRECEYIYPCDTAKTLEGEQG